MHLFLQRHIALDNICVMCAASPHQSEKLKATDFSSKTIKRSQSFVCKIDTIIITGPPFDHILSLIVFFNHFKLQSVLWSFVILKNIL